MKTETVATSRKPKSKLLTLTTVALICMLSASSAYCMPVADLPHTLQAYITHLLRYVRQGQQYAEEVQHNIRDYTHMQQQLISIGGLRDVSMTMTDTFAERPANFGMAAACPGADNSISLSALTQAFTLDMSGEIKKQQAQICQRIQMAKNTQYNEAVKMLKTIREQDTQLSEIAQERLDVGTDEGKLAANDNKLRQYLARSSTSMQYSTTVIQAYETYIKSLQDNQQMLTQQALTGNNGDETFATTLARKFVQGATLKIALDSARSDR
ncbi:MAG: hypothetical protein ABI644_07465 [Arenimonas sp.]